MVSLNNIQKEATPHVLFRKAHIDGKTKEKQENDYHQVTLAGTLLGREAFRPRRDIRGLWRDSNGLFLYPHGYQL